MAREISNSEDIIDSRDVIKRIDELESERQDLVDAIEDAQDTLADANDPTSAIADNPAEIVELEEAVTTAQDDLEQWDADNGDELKTLKALAEEGEGSRDWTHGETLIRDSYFEEYAQQLAEDIGAIDRDASWPNDCIDWEKAADALKMDYFSVDFDGVEYWIRA